VSSRPRGWRLRNTGSPGGGETEREETRKKLPSKGRRELVVNSNPHTRRTATRGGDRPWSVLTEPRLKGDTVVVGRRGMIVYSRAWKRGIPAGEDPAEKDASYTS